MTKIKIGFFSFGIIYKRLIEHFHKQCYPKYLLFVIKKITQNERFTFTNIA